MDLNEARAALPATIANEFAMRLLVTAELHFVNAYCATKNDKE